ncbi:unnamed protein product [Heligmosomoides polygyrus]|uniref:Ras-GEF domain-containing protein n=1 Tax=Heligmosomoides polygyrus TaxID=6339 RepID=A0A183GB62_HELPZ|nr:unnamed protein product [Heligmosomoides polygyrus]
MKEQASLGRRASIGIASSTTVTSRPRIPDEQVDHIRRVDSSYSSPAVLDLIFLYAKLQTSQILLSPQYTMLFGLQAKSRSCLYVSGQTKAVDVCTSLLNRRRIFAWIDFIVTMHEKYCVYDNLVRRKHWVDFDELLQPQPKRVNHDEKELKSFWWNINFPVFWKLVPTGSMGDLNMFCAQLEKITEFLRNRNPRRGKILPFVDNVRLYLRSNDPFE